MMHLEELKQDINVVSAVDWNMTPEEAVRLYLEWGNNWAGGNYVIRSKNDVSYYFIVYAWEDPPVIYLIRRNSEGAQELALIHMPDGIRQRFLDSIGRQKGVYAVDGEVRDWLQSELYAV